VAQGQGVGPSPGALSDTGTSGAAVQLGITGATTQAGGSGLLWGAAALAAAASATAYGLSRRRARQQRIAEMRQRAAEMASPEARQARLTSLRNAALTRVAPIQRAIASARAAATSAAAETATAAAAVVATAAAETQRRLAEYRRRIDEAMRQRQERFRADREARLEQAEQGRRSAAPSPGTTATGQPRPTATSTPTPEPVPRPTPYATPRPSEPSSERRLTEDYPPRGFPDPTGIPELVQLRGNGNVSYPRGSLFGILEWGDRYSAYTPTVDGGLLNVGAEASAAGGGLDASQYVSFSLGPLDVKFEKKLFYPSASISWRAPGVSSLMPGGTQVEFSHSVSVTVEGQGWNQITSVRYNPLDYRATSGQSAQGGLGASGTAGTYFGYRPLRLAAGVVLVTSGLGVIVTVGTLTGLISAPAWLGALLKLGG
jgi:hypothetical protein